MAGLVSFVSLGPGEPALCTARASARVSEADVVIGDQDGATAEHLVELARAGQRVVRAIVGDAMSSPVALDEVRAVSQAGVAFEVVPGVGMRAAAAAFVGVLGPAVRVPVDQVSAALQGEAHDAVVTLVAALGEPRQRVVVTNAAEAAARARELGAPLLVVVRGAPEPALRWFERRPLFGKRVLVTRAREQAEAAASQLREQGAEPVLVPTIEIAPAPDAAALARAIDDLAAGRYAWAAFTSANGVERTWGAIEASGRDARVFGGARLSAIGPATAAALARRGLRADVVAREFRGESLAEEMLRAMGPGAGQGGRVLLARAAKARDVLPDALRAAGWAVDVVAAYETRAPGGGVVDALASELAAGRLDAVTFTSSSTVENLCDLLGERALALLGRARLASIGPVTTETARARGLRVDVTASVYTLPGLIQALAASYG